MTGWEAKIPPMTTTKDPAGSAPAHLPRPGSIEARIDEQLQLLTEGMRDALQGAGRITADYDQYGHCRTAEFNNAIAIAKTSAEIVLALAKLNGRFHHDINVRRLTADGAPPPPPQD